MRLAVVAVVCAAVAGGTVAWAAVGGGGVVTSCFSKGTWRPIDVQAGETCKPSEQQLEMYSKAGADAAFLGVNGKAADSDLLDGIDSTGFQSRVTGTCSAPQAIRAIAQDGTVTCVSPASSPALAPVVSEIGLGTEVVLLDSGGIQIVGKCSEAGRADIVVRVSPGYAVNIVSDSRTLHIGQGLFSGDGEVAIGTADAAGYLDRGEFDVVNTYNAHAMNGTFYVFFFGSGCQFDASATATVDAAAAPSRATARLATAP